MTVRVRIGRLVLTGSTDAASVRAFVGALRAGLAAGPAPQPGNLPRISLSSAPGPTHAAPRLAGTALARTLSGRRL
jgi:hypothetical protein